MDWSHSIIAIPLYHYDSATSLVVTFQDTTVSISRRGRTMFDKKPDEEVAFYDTADESFATARENSRGLFHEVEGVPPDHPFN